MIDGRGILEEARAIGTCDPYSSLTPPSRSSRKDSAVAHSKTTLPPTIEPITEAAIWAVLEPLGWFATSDGFVTQFDPPGGGDGCLYYRLIPDPVLTAGSRS
jgi:hypothetical protein